MPAQVYSAPIGRFRILPAATNHSRDGHQGFTTGRLEAFSDGVIAIIITITVLELKVPHPAGLAGMRAVLPTLLVYLLSFSLTGIYWVNHHHLLHRTEEVDGPVLYGNLGFLFSLSLLPFFTSWLIEKHLDAFSTMLYSGILVVTGLAFLILRLAVARGVWLAGARAEQDRSVEHKHWLSLGLYLAAIPAALWHPVLSLLLDAAVTLVWILPSIFAGSSPSRTA